MSILDPRLLPLIETIALAGADWLAFELIAGLQRGLELEETESSLANARELVRSGARISRETIPPKVSAEMILGDNQIIWAAVYVLDRVENALAYLEKASSDLNVIASIPIQGEDDVPPPIEPSSTSIQIVIDDDELRTVTSRDLERARSAFGELRSAIENWSQQVREQLP